MCGVKRDRDTHKNRHTQRCKYPHNEMHPHIESQRKIHTYTQRDTQDHTQRNKRKIQCVTEKNSKTVRNSGTHIGSETERG